MLKVLIYALPVILAVYALVDLVQTRDEEIQGLPKLVWVLLIVLIMVIGPLAWLVAGRRNRRWFPLSPRAAGPSQPGGGRPMAPDDDPDFLRGLRGTRYTEPPAAKPPPRPDDEDGTPDPPPVGSR
jgi:hypothetical protein